MGSPLGTVPRQVTPRLSLLVQVPPYEDPVACSQGLRGEGLEVVLISDDDQIEYRSDVVRVPAGPGALDRAVMAASAPWIALADPGGVVDTHRLDALLATASDDE